MTARILVEATRVGFLLDDGAYHDLRSTVHTGLEAPTRNEYQPGDRFEVDAEQFDPSWMRRLDTPNGAA